jgi:hypothetical protein
VLALDLGVFNLLDLLFDTTYPGDPIKPTFRSFEFIQEQYDRLPDNLIVNRFEELISAFRIRQFAVSDVWDVTPLSSTFPYPTGMGMLERAMLLIDFTQDVMLDVSHLLSWPIGPGSVHAPFDSRDYLQIKYLNIGIDFTQQLIEDTRDTVIKYAVDLGDRGILRLEHGIDHIILIFRKEGYEQKTFTVISTPGLSR